MQIWLWRGFVKPIRGKCSLRFSFKANFSRGTIILAVAQQTMKYYWLVLVNKLNFPKQLMWILYTLKAQLNHKNSVNNVVFWHNWCCCCCNACCWWTFWTSNCCIFYLHFSRVVHYLLLLLRPIQPMQTYFFLNTFKTGFASVDNDSGFVPDSPFFFSNFCLKLVRSFWTCLQHFSGPWKRCYILHAGWQHKPP